MSRRKIARRLTQPSTQPLVTRSALERFPAEIWGTIFSMACVDNGYTGRSLSEVSRYINEVSKSYKYQCIAVDDHKRLRRLTAVLKKLHPDARCVRHLFISSIELGREVEFFEADKNRLLIVVAPTLRSLEVYFHATSLSLKFPLPSLLDLTVYCASTFTLDNITTRTFECYPSLQRMHWGSAAMPLSCGLLPLIRWTAPALTHLRISTSTRRTSNIRHPSQVMDYNLMDFVRAELEEAYGLLSNKQTNHLFMSQGAATIPTLPMPQVIWQPSPIDNLHALRRIRDADKNFLLLKELKEHAYVSAVTAKSSWLAVRAGARDCWDIDTKPR